MNIETLIAKEAAGLLVRRPDKLKHVIGQYLISFKDREVGRTGRATYFFIRYMDDLLDGDRTLPNGDQPLPHIASIRSQIERDNFTGKPEIMKLGEYALDALIRKARDGDDPRQEFLDEIDVMVFDNQRQSARRTLTTEQLNDYYLRTFSPLNNLMLIGLSSGLRASDIPEFSLCQGRVYSLEHLSADWRIGIINVPKEILEAAVLNSGSTFLEVIKSPVFKIWAQNELLESKAALLSLQEKFNCLPEKLTTRIYDTLTGSMLHFIKKYFQNSSSSKY